MSYAQSEWQAFWNMDYRECRIRKGNYRCSNPMWTTACKYAYANRHRPKLFVAPGAPPYPDRLLEMQGARRYFFRRLEVLRWPDKRMIREFLRYRYGLE